MLNKFFRKSETDHVEAEKMARIENAQRDLDALKERSSRATTSLRERAARNHWVESIELIVNGRA